MLDKDILRMAVDLELERIRRSGGVSSWNTPTILTEIQEMARGLAKVLKGRFTPGED